MICLMTVYHAAFRPSNILEPTEKEEKSKAKALELGGPEPEPASRV